MSRALHGGEFRRSVMGYGLITVCTCPEREINRRLASDFEAKRGKFAGFCRSQKDRPEALRGGTGLGLVPTATSYQINAQSRAPAPRSGSYRVD